MNRILLSGLLLLSWITVSAAQVLAPIGPGSGGPGGSGGGGGTPCTTTAGSLQYNNSGTFGCVSGWTTNGTTALTGGASTTLAIGGAAIGSNALAVTGQSSFGAVVIPSASMQILADGSTTAISLNYQRAGVSQGSAGVVQWTGGGVSAAVTSTLSQASAGILQVGTTAANASGSLSLVGITATGTVQATTIRPNPYIQWPSGSGSSIIYSYGAGIIRLGDADVASGAVPYILETQGNSGAATTGPLFTIKGAAGGSGASVGGELRLQGGTPSAGTGGAITFYTSATTTPAVALTLSAAKLATFAGQVIITNIGSDAALTDSTVCQDTTNHQLYSGSGTLGICLGTSGRQFKQDFAPMTAGLAEITKLDLQRFRYRTGFGDNGARLQYGLMAQDVEKVLPDLAGHDANGNTINYDAGALLFVSLRAIQELKADNDNIRAELKRAVGQR